MRAPRWAGGRVELLVALALAGVTMAPALALIGRHGVFNGGYGIDVTDLMQYMAFIRDSGQHGLIANQFDTVADPHLFLDPVFALSGLVWRLGASIQLALLFWVPISAVAIFLGFRAYARRHLGAGTAAAAGLALSLLWLTPATALVSWLGGQGSLQFGTQVVGLEMFAGGYAWGGPTALAIAATPVALLLSERMLAAAPFSWRLGALTGVCGAFVAWIHPWQGLTLLGVWGALLVWGRLSRRHLRLLLPVALTCLPLAYYLILSGTRSSWATVSRASGYAHFGTWLWLGLLPAGLALLGVGGRHLDSGARMLRLWPLASAVVYLALERTWFYHALAGLSLPLAILTVQGWRRRVGRPRLGLALAALLMAPGLVWAAQELKRTRPAHFFAPSDAQALALLERLPQAGPVLAAPVPLGQAVPAFTGRSTWVGHPIWTPGYGARRLYADALFAGRLPRASALILVRVSRARFLLQSCSDPHTDLRRLLGPAISRAWPVGCATVYAVSPRFTARSSAGAGAGTATRSARS